MPDGKMDEKQIVTVVKREIARADSFLNNRISHERKLAYDYYYGRPFGNEKDGRSQIIAADVAQAVDSAVPAIVEIFVSGDKAVEFTPRSKEDVESAEQATIGANYVFFTQNNGYALTHDFVKDGLFQKTGAFKWKWDTSQAMVEKTWQGLDAMTVEVLQKNLEASDGELIGINSYVDPQAGIELYDVTARIKKTAGKVKIIVPPPEELLISPDATTLEVMDMPFIAHTPLLTASDLREMGIEQSVIDELPTGDEDDANETTTARQQHNNTNAVEEDEEEDLYRYNECYIRLDEDGDGVAELRKICIVGTKILHDEPTDHIPIAIWTPKVMPHEVVGVSLADDVMDLQLLKSTIWRMTMDSWYQAVYPRMFGKGDIDMDAVMSLVPGGYIQGGPNSELMPIEVPFTGQSGFQMLEYADQEKDARVGFSAMGPGMDPDSINKTATFVREMTNQTNARAKLIARNAAEFGFKPLFRGIMYLLAKYQQQALMVRLNNKFVPVDPETWNKEYDMTCNVGLGMGSKDQQLMHLQLLGQDIQAVAASPYAPVLLTPEKIFNFFEKKANLAGFPDAEQFMKKPVNPDGTPAPLPPPPKPEAVQVAEIKAQTDQQAKAMDVQAEGAKMQMDERREAAQAQADMAVEQQKASLTLQIEREKLAAQMIFEREKLAMEMQYKQWEKNLEIQSQERIAAMNARVEASRPENRPN